MNEYEGLNLPQLLDLMHGLVEPAPIPWTPQTAGWTIVGTWLLACAVLLTLELIARRRRNRYRRAALAELDALEEQARDGRAIGGPLASLVKRTALCAYPRRQVASLCGQQWADFLRSSSRHDRRVDRAAEQLAAAAYRPDIDAATLISPARRWIKKHRSAPGEDSAHA